MENNYYIDFEFLEGKQEEYFFGIKTETWALIWVYLEIISSGLISICIGNRNFIGLFLLLWAGVSLWIYAMNKGKYKTPPTIDLISVGLVSGDGRELYEISNEFNIHEAWNRFDLKYGDGDQRNLPPIKDFWIRDNVLRPIFDDLVLRHKTAQMERLKLYGVTFKFDTKFTKNNLKKLITIYGNTNQHIATKIIHFTYPSTIETKNNTSSYQFNHAGNIKFYGYFSGFDYVCMSWLFGKMIDLPKQFPMYFRDLQQTLDELTAINADLTNHSDYPKITNEHNSLSDAKFNKKLHGFLIEHANA